MKDKIISIENCWICTLEGSKVLPVFGDVIIVNGTISRIRGKSFATYQKSPDKVNKESYNAAGRVVTIPNVNFHDHIYSRLAKGLPANGGSRDFISILKNLWWKLDRILDPDMIAASTRMASLQSIKNGVTYIFDHHSSQEAIEGSLSIIKENLKAFGLRGVLCFETSDRNGFRNAVAGLEENRNFASSLSGDDFAAMLGLHASFTLSDDILAEAFALKKNLKLGIHIHVAEDKADIKLSEEYTKYKPVKRLWKYKLMDDMGILVHGVHLKKRDFTMIEENGAALAFCPDSNMNNSVGLPQFNSIPPGIPFLLGTDGMHANPAGSMKQVFLLSRHQGGTFEEAFNLVNKIYFDQHYFIKKYFPDFTSLQEGERADMIVWDYVPVNPLNGENFWGHYIYGLLDSPVNTVIQKGKFLMKNRLVSIADENKIKDEITLQGERLYKAFAGKTN